MNSAFTKYMDGLIKTYYTTQTTGILDQRTARLPLVLRGFLGAMMLDLMVPAATVGGSEIPLPVELVSFTATANGMNADLHWSTALEKVCIRINA